MSLHIDEGGEGESLLVLLHGLGATAAVWTPFMEALGLGTAASRWRGRWWAPDLPGHGRSDRADSYGVERIAETLGRELASRAPAASAEGAGSSRAHRGRLVVLGHSLGGAVGLALASGRYGVQPDVLFGVGIVLVWTAEDIRRMAHFAAQPAKLFPTEAAAWDRYLKVSGLAGFATADSPIAARGIVADGPSWRLATDPRANGSGEPPFAKLFGSLQCPVHLARGSRDPLITLEHTRRFDPNAVDLGGQGHGDPDHAERGNGGPGHNVMVEAPHLVRDWMAAHGALAP